LRDRWYVRPFGGRFFDPALWSLQRRGVARGVAAGLAICFVPLPIHIPLGIAVAIMARLNLPATMLGVLCINPLTVVPAYYFAYRAGAFATGYEPQAFEFQLNWDWLQYGLGPVWRPFLTGCLICGLAAALIAWVSIELIWRWRVRKKYQMRAAAARGKSALVDQNSAL
jgi:hypothetical protein